MSSVSLPRASRRVSRLPRATIWVAGSLSVLLHWELGWRLWHLQPAPDELAPRVREPLSEWTVDLTPVPPVVVVPEPPQPAASSTVATASTPKKRRRQVAPATARLPPADAPEQTLRRVATAADFQAQMQADTLPSDDWEAAAQNGAAGSSATAAVPGGRPALDLSLRAGPQGAARVVGAIAGALGAPTRGDTEKVGDIHSAMLVNMWNDRHHGRLFRGCHQRDPAETMAIYVERCGRAPPAQ